jgi:hypothetical protein
MGLKFYFLIIMGVYLILFQPVENSFSIGAISIIGGLFWLWLYSRINSKNESSTTTNNLPDLTESDIEKIKPFSTEIFQRVDAGEKLDVVAQSVALRAKVDPIQVVAYAVGVAQALKDFKKGLDGSK